MAQGRKAGGCQSRKGNHSSRRFKNSRTAIDGAARCFGGRSGFRQRPSLIKLAADGGALTSVSECAIVQTADVCPRA